MAGRKCSMVASEFVTSSVTELVTTELSYLVDLTDICRGYYDYIESGGGKSPTNVASGSCDNPSIGNSRLKSEEITILFGNIRELHTFHQLLGSEIDKCQGNPEQLAKCFIAREDQFVMLYSFYCANYPNAVSLLSQLILNNNEIFELFQDAQSEIGHALPLGSYILKPVQRILKYHLLLEEIYKNHQHLAKVLGRCLEVMTRVAQQVNEIQRQYEAKVHVQEIQSILTDWSGNDLTSHGSIRLEDEHRMLGARDLRQLFLFDEILLVTKFTEAGFLQHKAHILNSNLIVLETIPKEPLAFQVAPYDNSAASMTFITSSIEKKRVWIRALRKTIIDSYNETIPRSAKTRLLQLDPMNTRRGSLIGLMSPGLQSSSGNEGLALRRKISGLSSSPTAFREHHQRNRSVIQRKAVEAQNEKRKSMSLKLVDRNEIESIKANVQVHFKEKAEEIESHVPTTSRISPLMEREIEYPQAGEQPESEGIKSVSLQRCKSELTITANIANQATKKVSRSYDNNEIRFQLWQLQRQHSNSGDHVRPRLTRSSSDAVARVTTTSSDDQHSASDERGSERADMQSEEHESGSDYNSSIVRSQRAEFQRRLKRKAASFGGGPVNNKQDVFFQSQRPQKQGETYTLRPTPVIFEQRRSPDRPSTPIYKETSMTPTTTSMNTTTNHREESPKRSIFYKLLKCCFRPKKDPTENTSQIQLLKHTESTCSSVRMGHSSFKPQRKFHGQGSYSTETLRKSQVNNTASFNQTTGQSSGEPRRNSSRSSSTSTNRRNSVRNTLNENEAPSSRRSRRPSHHEIHARSPPNIVVSMYSSQPSSPAREIDQTQSSPITSCVQSSTSSPEKIRSSRNKNPNIASITNNETNTSSLPSSSYSQDAYLTNISHSHTVSQMVEMETFKYGVSVPGTERPLNAGILVKNGDSENNNSDSRDAYLENLDKLYNEVDKKSTVTHQKIQTSLEKQLGNIEKQKSIIRTIYSLQLHSSAQPEVVL